MSASVKMVRYDEPWTCGMTPNDWVPVEVHMTEESAIKLQRWAARRHNPSFVYQNDSQALDDFMTTHWATRYEREVPDDRTR